MFLAFKRAKGLVGRLINFFSGRGGFMHVATIFSDGRLIEAHFGKGVQWYDYKPTGKGWVFYKVPCTEAGEFKARVFAEATVDKDYDTLGVLDLINGDTGGLICQHDDKWFCDEHAARLCEVSGALPDIYEAKESPNSLEKMVRAMGWDRYEELP
jgi:hypothetical protein